MSGKVIAINISEKKGVMKKPIPAGNFIENFGLEGDAHAGKWHRQVSLLSWQAIEDFKARGAIVSHGCFGENLIVDGIDFAALPVGTRLSCNEVLMEVSQIGKECHSHCQIFHTMGDCIMPRQGVFAKVLHGGLVRPGDEMLVLPVGE